MTHFVRDAALGLLNTPPILDNPYFTALKQELSLSDFCATQTQFFFAVTFFSRPMAALIGRIHDPVQRLAILHNVVEEHGDFDIAGFHHSTFLTFLQRLGCNTEHINNEVLWPEVRAFNSVLSTACVLDELEVGIACMGIIELAFADIAAFIGQSVVQRGWIEADQLIHYKLHAEIDHRHADEFFAVVEDGWHIPEKRYLIEQGLALGAYSFNRLYADFYTRIAQPRTKI